MKIGVITTFSAAHSLPGHPKCGEIHGHNYKVRAVVDFMWSAEEPPEEIEEAIPLDFGVLRKILEGVIRPYDHTNLNPLFEWPTAEQIAWSIAHKVGNRLKDIWANRDDVLLNSVTARVWETDKYFAEEKWVQRRNKNETRQT